MKIFINGVHGYIGSALSDHLVPNHEIRGTDIKVADISDYRKIKPADIVDADVVIHLAGHSSVASCEADPWGSVENNVTDFLPFVKRLASLDKPPLLLWASSGSVLSDVHSLYDEQKRALEALVPRLYPRSIGLRFASVCGVSPNMRDDIILNAMVKSAVEDGLIKMANPSIRKPVLGLKDLCAQVRSLVSLAARSDDDIPSMVELCSFVISPAIAADAVSLATGAVIAHRTNSRAYNFNMRPSRLTTETLDTIVAELVEHYRGRE